VTACRPKGDAVTTIIRIERARDSAYEVYYEPDENEDVIEAIRILRERGWIVNVDHVDAEAECARLLERAAEANRRLVAMADAGKRGGWSSNILRQLNDLAAEAKRCAALARDVEAAAQGEGSLPCELGE